MAELQVDIVSVEGAVWSGKATSVTATTVEGEIGILFGRQPLLAQMAAEGVATVRTVEGDILVFGVAGGLLSCTGRNVVVMAEHAVSAEDLSIEQLEREAAELSESTQAYELSVARVKLRAAKRLASV